MHKTVYYHYLVNAFVQQKEASGCPLVIIILFALALSSPIYYTGLFRTTWATRGTCLSAINLRLSPAFIILYFIILFAIFSAASSVSSLCFRNDWLPTCFGQAQYKPVFFSLVPFRFNTLNLVYTPYILIYSLYSCSSRPQGSPLFFHSPAPAPALAIPVCLLPANAHLAYCFLLLTFEMSIACVYSYNYKYSIFLTTRYDNSATYI